jgi:protein arginine N-methyltransferase 3
MAASGKADEPVKDNPASDSESDDSRNEDGWDDVEEEEDETAEVISLLDDRVFPDVISMLEHCKNKHNFDFLAVRQKLQLDFHGCVKLVNYSRSLISPLFVIIASTMVSQHGAVVL